MSVTQSSVWTLVRDAVSLSLKDRMMLPLGSREMLHMGWGSFSQPLWGSLRKAMSSTLHLSVSAVTGANTKKVFLLVFLSEMKISFSWASTELAGHVVRGWEASAPFLTALAYDGAIGEVCGWELKVDLISAMALVRSS